MLALGAWLVNDGRASRRHALNSGIGTAGRRLSASSTAGPQAVCRGASCAIADLRQFESESPSRAAARLNGGLAATQLGRLPLSWELTSTDVQALLRWELSADITMAFWVVALVSLMLAIVVGAVALRQPVA